MLSMLVRAVPLSAVILSYTDTAAGRQVAGTVPRRGLCGDVYLVATPAAPGCAGKSRHVNTKRQNSFRADLSELSAGATYSLCASVSKGGRRVIEHRSPKFRGKHGGKRPVLVRVERNPTGCGT